MMIQPLSNDMRKLQQITKLTYKLIILIKLIPLFLIVYKYRFTIIFIFKRNFLLSCIF